MSRYATGWIRGYLSRSDDRCPFAENSDEARGWENSRRYRAGVEGEERLPALLDLASMSLPRVAVCDFRMNVADDHGPSDPDEHDTWAEAIRVHRNMLEHRKTEPEAARRLAEHRRRHP